MLRDRLAADLADDELAPGFVRPAWDDYCFANVPDTVLSVLGDEPEATGPLPDDVFEGVATDIDHVVLAFVDGFGWNHFQRVRDDHPLLARLVDRATVTPLTSGYPSETAAAVSTIHTGRQPAEHGVLGWNAYVEALGGTVQTLPFADRDRTPLTEVRDDPDPAALLDGTTLYERLNAASVLVQPDFGPSLYDSQANRGASVVNYTNPAQAAYRARETLERATEPTYCYCYFPTVDKLSHASGAAHPETDAQVGAVCHAIERELVEKLDSNVAERTLFLLTADHGEVDTVPENRVDLGRVDLESHLARDTNGEPIPALGGPRNLQFHAREGHRDALRATLEDGLTSLDPLILDREAIVDEGLFGDREPSSRFLERCPDLLVVPRKGFADEEEGTLANVGMHGGMAPDEMLVPFAAARVDALRP
ncbi:alkaline phosphatase family protein [Halococcus hamelinensis]|uniref:Type I phosphodiesterase/nucleotide pyrophosphatase n=1 Tax=Halococcus hamelinensis 100A6 TaxID=1132509 RepID=M0M1Y3_9EURY|nr:alkaline phosphatase family protein [Halococcus hamelinensis]EMA38410.1 type I phosphodiesterase/nucleotide pyrophosphatase [Halococcus hamelinensis 100A6]